MKKTRAVLLGTNAWPFIIRYWLENFKTWEDKVDRVYLALDKNVKPEYIEYLRAQIPDKIEVILTKVDWPNTYVDVYRASTEDLLLIMHDDTYINSPKMLDIYFDMAEQGKVIAPRWQNYQPRKEIEEWLKEKYHIEIPHDGYSFMLDLIFISRENLAKTSLNFNGWQNKQKWGADTGFKLMLDLLDNEVEIIFIPKYHAETIEKGDYLHFGGLGTSLPLTIDSREISNPNWNDKLKLKLNLLEEALKLDNYANISEYRDFVQKRIKEIRLGGM